MAQFATLQDKVDFESEVPIEDRWTARTVYEFLSQTVERNPDGNALTFQITSGPKDKRETFTYGELLGKVTQAANLFRSMGIGEGDVVAELLRDGSDLPRWSDDGDREPDQPASRAGKDRVDPA